MVYSLSQPGTETYVAGTWYIIQAGEAYCTDVYFRDGFGVDDPLPAVKILRTWIEQSTIPTRNRSKYLYKSKFEPTLYRRYTGDVYTTTNAGSIEYYAGDVIQCLGKADTNQFFKPVDQQKIYGTSYPIIEGVPTIEGLLLETTANTKPAHFVTKWIGSGNNYNEHDVYLFRGQYYAFQHEVSYDSLTQQWKDKIETTSDRIYEEDHMLGARCHLQPNDVIGIDVNLYASYLGKRLMFRLLLQQSC